MDNLTKMLQAYRDGILPEKDLLLNLRNLPFENLDFAHVDHHREIRTGFPEVIFCEGKTAQQVKKIADAILKRKSPLLATRAAQDIYRLLKKNHPQLKFNRDGRVVYSKPVKRHKSLDNNLLIVTAGTSDIPVAEEAAQTALAMGFKPKTIYDVGVAGLHRLLKYRPELTSARVIIVVAGMEGALASVVGGLVAVPVIAVPTSTGYGTSFHGVTALLAMLNSCSSGITVVNIDNGFGAACAACQILELLVEKED